MAGTVVFTSVDLSLVDGIVLLGAVGMRLAVRRRRLLPMSTIPMASVSYLRGKHASSGPNQRLSPEHCSGE